MKKSPRPHTQQGFSLIEIMVSLLISSLLMMSILQLFSRHRDSYQLQEQLGIMRENARFAMNLLTRDIRQAAYAGCNRDTPRLYNRLLSHQAAFQPFTGLQGWEYIMANTMPGGNLLLDEHTATPLATNGNNQGWRGWQTQTGEAALDANPRVIIGSDILRIWYPAEKSTRVLAIQNKTHWQSPDVLTLQDKHVIEAGDIALLSDCRSSLIIQVCRMQNQGQYPRLHVAYQGGHCRLGNKPGTLPAVPSGPLSTHMEITRLTSRTYFIGKKAGKRSNPPSLYFADLNRSRNDSSTGKAEQLVEGVETMQILYGEDTDNDEQVDVYQTADRVNNWRKVLALRIGLLMRSIRQVSGQDQATGYNVNGSSISIPSPDQHLRRVYTRTIVLRNRTS